MLLKALVVEDIPAIREAIVKRISEHPDLQVVDYFDNVEEATNYFLDGATVDALFLDIRLFGDYGWEILRSLRREDLTIPPVVLITGEEERGYAETVFQEFRMEVVDYIVKPFADKWTHRQNECVRLIKERLEELRAARPRMNRLPLSKGATTEFVPVEEVVCFVKGDTGLEIHFNGEQRRHIDPYGALGTYEKDIHRPNFVRISRQAVVNIDYVSGIHNGGLKAKALIRHEVVKQLECSKEGLKALKRALHFGNSSGATP